jgi:hypothetical protein
LSIEISIDADFSKIWHGSGAPNGIATDVAVICWSLLPFLGALELGLAGSRFATFVAGFTQSVIGK